MLLFRPRYVLGMLAFACAGALMAAYIAEYHFGLLPCELCLWQRPPFYAVTLLGLVGFCWPHVKAQQWLLGLCGVILLGNAGLAFFHTGVEQKWWAGLEACGSSEIDAGASLEDLRAQILSAPLIRCDTPAWEFHGLTMASLNVVFCVSLAILAFYALTRRRPQSG